MFDPKKLTAELSGRSSSSSSPWGWPPRASASNCSAPATPPGWWPPPLPSASTHGPAYAIGPVSGAHVNPAVTLGFVGAGRMTAIEGIGYWIAQFAGAIAGAAALWGIFGGIPTYSRKVQGLGADGYGVNSYLHLNQTGAFFVEVVLTFVFVTVILFATHKAAIQGEGGLAIGMALVVVHLIGIPLTGTSVNPARSLAPALIVGGTALSQVWLFLVAPLVGAAIAAGGAPPHRRDARRGRPGSSGGGAR